MEKQKNNVVLISVLVCIVSLCVVLSQRLFVSRFHKVFLEAKFCRLFRRLLQISIRFSPFFSRLIKFVRKVYRMHYFNFYAILFSFKMIEFSFWSFNWLNIHTHIIHTGAIGLCSQACSSSNLAHDIVELPNIWNRSMALNVLVAGSPETWNEIKAKKKIRINSCSPAQNCEGKKNNRKLNEFHFKVYLLINYFSFCFREKLGTLLISHCFAVHSSFMLTTRILLRWSISIHFLNGIKNVN